MIQILGKFTRDEDSADGESCCGLSHPEYRALVVRQALKSGKSPNAKTMLRSKQAVDRALGRAGIAVKIPGARPGRRTI